MDFFYLILWTLGIGFLGVLAVVYRHLTYWKGKDIPWLQTIPIVGIFFPAFVRSKSFPQLMIDIYYACPGAKYFATHDFGLPVIVVKDPEIIKEVAVKSFDYFPNHRGFIEEDFDPLLSRNIFSLKDDRWREMRTTLTPSFTANKMKIMFQLVSKCSLDFVQHLKDHPEVAKDLDMKDVYTRYTNDVIATAAFGIDVNSMANRTNEFYEFGKDAVSFDGFFRIIKLMGARMFPNLLRMMGFSFLSPNTERFFKTLVNDTIKTRKEKGIVRPDMIHLLMQAMDNEKGVQMTNDDIIAQAFIFFLAGFDTSSRLMCFVSHILAHHPDVQERLRDEVERESADVNGEISYETIVRMKYMDMVLSETLRLYPPMPFTDRVCIKPYTLPPSVEGSKGFTVQPNTSLWFPVFGLLRDPKYFEDPEKFDPERFNDENKKNINPYVYIPFGLGPRKCIGDRFALMEAKILVVHLLINFNLKPSPKTPKDIVFTKKTFNMVPDNGFWMELEPRK